MEQIFKENDYPLDMTKLQFLSDKGSEFTVYRYLDSVIKIYKNDYELSHLSLDELNILKMILTQRILMPKGMLWNCNHELVGYEMPLVIGEKEVEGDNLCGFFDELEIIRQDLELLCSNFVALRDINLSNTMYNGCLYLVDPGNYLIGQLDKIISRMNISDPLILGELRRILMNGDYSKLKDFADSLPQAEKQNLLREWNYDKINKLVDMLLFARRSSIDSFQFRQIVQFIMREREKNGFIYNLDVLRMFFNQELCVGDAIDDFVKRCIKDDPKERQLFLSLYNK